MAGPRNLGKRLLVAYFSSSDAAQVRALNKRLRKRLDSATILSKRGAAQELSAQLQLEDEILLDVWVATEDLAEAVQLVQFSGARSVFIFAASATDRLEEARCVLSAKPTAWRPFLAILEDLERELLDSSEYLRDSLKIGHPASPAAQWIIDNSYIAEFALSAFKQELKRAYKLLTPTEISVLWNLADRYVATESRGVDEDAMRDFLEREQSSLVLSSSQLWNFPLFLKFLIVENVVVLACHNRRTQHLRELAFFWANRSSESAKRGKKYLERVGMRLSSRHFSSDATFLVALAEQLQDQETTLHGWSGPDIHQDLPEKMRDEHAREAGEGKKAADYFAALKSLPRLNFRAVFDSVSRLERLLCADPAGVYPRSAFETRDFARQRVVRLARQSGRSEIEIAQLAIDVARSASGPIQNQVLYYLVSEGAWELEHKIGAKIGARRRIRRTIRKHSFAFYSSSIVLLALVMTATVVFVANQAGLSNPYGLLFFGALTLFPILELATQLVQTLVVSIFPPLPSPKLDFRSGIPDEARTLVVVPMMMASEESLQDAFEKLEVRYLANREQNLSFALLADFTDADAARKPNDPLLIRAARNHIENFETKYGFGQFTFLYRHRSWSTSESLWIGKERKRGKIEALNQLLCGENSELLQIGVLPQGIRYVITVDADTKLPPRVALRLIEAIAHPLHRVEVDPQTGVRRSGYAVFQPRVSIALPGAVATRFTKIFADAQGSDPYCTVVSDAQQDLFGEGIFHGKAIYDVQAFHSILKHRFPAETILSHDLIEGAHVGVRYSSDIELLEDVPSDYAAFCARQHRWTRGDWQIWQWCLPEVPHGHGPPIKNPLNAINRWRVLDNLRRSLTAPVTVLLLILGWAFSRVDVVWTLTIALAIGIPALAPLLERWSRQMDGTVYGWRGATEDAKRAAILLSVLPHQAWLSVDALARALFRLHFSRRKLLEWLTAEHAGLTATNLQSRTMRQLIVIAAVSALLLLGLGLNGHLRSAAPLLLLWIAAPYLVQWLAQSVTQRENQRLDSPEESELRQLARLTWRYFDDLVNEESSWLPPDNTQLQLRVEVAQRTSPTNIGLWLNSAVAATDFGFLTPSDFAARTSKTFETLNRLERYEGHFLNWYDTRSAAPLEPKYVSTVDSGNFIASLWHYGQGCLDLRGRPIIPAACFRGLAELVALIADEYRDDPALKFALQGIRESLGETEHCGEAIKKLRVLQFHSASLREPTRWPAFPQDNLVYWIAKLSSEVESWIKEVDSYLRWVDVLMRPSDESLKTFGLDVVAARKRLLESAISLEELAQGHSPEMNFILSQDSSAADPEWKRWLAMLRIEFQAASQRADATLKLFDALINQSESLAQSVNMNFLYDSQRRLFGIGYTVGHPRVFHSHYDLLASECRLASLVAIAKGDVPLEHWFVLSRPWINSPKRQALLSWSGTMFEYLMPALFLEPFENSLLAEACNRAVEAQMEFSHPAQNVWGVSESAYGALDANGTYQYRAFGVPSLALNPAVDPGLVISPYSSVLALMIRPADALENIRRLKAAGLIGSLGLYEAIDYTRAAKREARPGIVIYTYMAHHQAMSLLALSNVIGGEPLQRRRFHRDPRVRAVESLLFEKIPIAAVPAPDLKPQPVTIARIGGEDRHWSALPPNPKTFITSNGVYSLMLSSNGSGYGQWKQFAVNRWRADSTLDDWGHLIWIRDVKSGRRLLVSHPFRGKAESRLVTFSPERAEYLTKDEDLECKLEIVVASDFDGEVRRLTVSNRSIRSRTFELTSYLELALAPQTADATHQAFSKLFVETQFVEDGVLLAHRRQRSPEDEDVWVLYVVSGPHRNIRHETDRREFLGRNREVFRAAGLNAFPAGAFGSVLDPIFSSQFELTIEGRDQIQISISIAAHSSRAALLDLVSRLREETSASRQLELAWFRSQLQFRHLRIEASASHRFQDLASLLIFPVSSMRGSEPPPDRSGQSMLWKFGISGDIPMVLTTIDSNAGLPLLRELLLAKAFLRIRGLELDLIVLSVGEAGYETPLRKAITRLIHAHSADLQTSGAGKVFQLVDSDLTVDERKFLHWSSQVVFPDHQGPLQRQLLRAVPALPIPALPAIPEGITAPMAISSRPVASPETMQLFNGLGGFTRDGREYVLNVGPEQCPPVPWANVIANPTFGLLLTEAGIGPTWSGNSQMNRLTPWRNDPVTDRVSECLYIRDEVTGKFWSATPSPSLIRPHARIRHGQGYSVYEMNVEDIQSSLTVFCAPRSRLKYALLTLRNSGDIRREITVTHYAEWVFGSLREPQQSRLRATYLTDEQLVVVRQHWNEAFANELAFVCCDKPIVWRTLDRSAFLGPNGSHARPQAMTNSHSAPAGSPPNDNCSALRCNLTLEPDQELTVLFAMGTASTLEEAREMRAQCNSSAALAILEQIREQWNRSLETIQVETPEPSIDCMVNRWLLYQSLSCRFWGRTALYQSGGALGFRDQLQDSLAFLYTSPSLTRSHLLVAASSQFAEGDVLHWWHPISGLGVRTRCSDDMLWLPWVLSRYLDVTQDHSILSEQAGFVDGPQLEEGQHERMFTLARTGHQATLLEHARLALRYAARVGPHGISLIGNGDWNDGMNRIGPEGRGESIWMAWFFCDAVRRWKPYAHLLPESDWLFLEESAASIARSVEEFGWNGEWYLRAFFDDGTPLGVPGAAEAQIDSLPQSWAVLSRAADKDRAARALSQARKHLFRPELGVMNLFTPPFDKLSPHPGYIMGYPPGVRENGGQYTHGALWMAQALAQSGLADEALEVLQISNPAHRSRAREGVRQYWGEPYAVAADISSSPGREGRAGWTWYTGSAGWMYRIWIEDVFGFKLRGNKVRFEPSLPDSWPGCRLDYRFGSSLYRFHLSKEPQPIGDSARRILHAGPNSPELELIDDGNTHDIVVALPVHRPFDQLTTLSAGGN